MPATSPDDAVNILGVEVHPRLVAARALAAAVADEVSADSSAAVAVKGILSLLDVAIGWAEDPKAMDTAARLR